MENKITKSKLKQIIKEELEAVLSEEELMRALDESWLEKVRAMVAKEKPKKDSDAAAARDFMAKEFGTSRPDVTVATGDTGIPIHQRSTTLEEDEIEEFYEVDALGENEEYCPVCAPLEEKKKKKACKPSKGKRFAKRVDGKCRSFGQAGQAKGGGDRIRPGTKKGDAYCARSAGIKKCKNPPCANTLSRKKWKCKGKKSMKE